MVNEVLLTITNTLDRVLLDYGGTWGICEDCQLVIIDAIGYRDCRADNWRSCPVISATVKDLL